MQTIKDVISKFFCHHKWKTHSKEKVKWDELELVEGTELWLNPITQKKQYCETTEILICECCGKIKKLTY